MFGPLVHSSLLLLGLSLPSAYGAAAPASKHLSPARDKSSYAVTSNYAPLLKRTKTSKSNALKARHNNTPLFKRTKTSKSNVLKARQNNTPSSSSSSSTSSASSTSSTSPVPSAALTIDSVGTEYLVSVEWAGTNYSVVVDTGSSDMWLAQSGFQCVDSDGNNLPQVDCLFGPLFNGTFNGGQIPNQNLYIDYGGMEIVSGIVGYENVTIAGITVSNQEVGLVNEARWEGDGTASGVMGLAYEGLTSAYQGTDPSKDTKRAPYPPFFTNMISQRLISNKFFSLALQRETGGYIAFGGLPPVNISSAFFSTPIELDPENSDNELTLYAITAALYYANSTTPSVQYAIDAGSTLLYVPSSVAEDANNAFTPPATYNAKLDLYFVACNATPPFIAVTINNGENSFTINPVDLINQRSQNKTTGMCWSSVQNAGGGPNLLGQPFLQSVVAVFDVGNTQMSFAAHENY